MTDQELLASLVLSIFVVLICMIVGAIITAIFFAIDSYKTGKKDEHN